MFWALLENYLYARIVFHVSLNFDPVKEILKIWYQIYILIKKSDYSEKNTKNNEETLL